MNQDATSPSIVESPSSPGMTQAAATLYRPQTLLWMAAITLLMIPLVTLVDAFVARWFNTQPLPSELSSTLDLTLVFSHGTGVFLILVGIILLAPRKRWDVPRLAALALGGGAVATIVKMFVLRPRPSLINWNAASHDTAWLWMFDWDLSQVASFDAGTRSFPSGNIATAVALTVGLWVLLPRGRWLFAAVCLGTTLQRMNCGSHYFSDILGGAGVGFLWSYVCFHPSLLGGVFDKIGPEQSPRRRREQRLAAAELRRRTAAQTEPAGGIEPLVELTPLGLHSPDPNRSESESGQRDAA